MEAHKKNNLIVVIVSVVIVLISVGTALYFNNKAKEKEAEMAETEEMMNFEKEQLEKEFTDFNSEFSGITTNIRNDSLVKLLDDQKTKVQQLLEELKITKSTNARRISELKKELATVRKVMVQYVNQIDSLNRTNKILKNENVEVHRKYQAANQTVQELSKEKESLNQVVTRAAIMEVTNFSMAPLNSKGKKTGWFSATANLQFNFTIAKNITAQPGEKTVYLRITRPDDDVLTKGSGNTFAYEGRNIPYSASKKIEYTGEAQANVLYWKVDEILPKGTYRAEFFIDGNRVGSFKFEFEK